jgi:Ca2+-binding EF-hand superfamily protein
MNKPNKDLNSTVNDSQVKEDTEINYRFRLQPEDVQNIKRVFDLYDEQFDGFIQVKDLGKAMRGLGLIPSNAEITKLALEMDTEPPTGKIDFTKFLVYMARAFRDASSTRDNGKSLSYKESIKKVIENAFTGKICLLLV